jgi:hypothetical protein
MLDYLVELVLMPDVGLVALNDAARRPGRGHGLVQVPGSGHRVGNVLDLLADVEGDDAGAEGREPERVRPSLPAGGSRNENHFAGEAGRGRAGHAAIR